MEGGSGPGVDTVEVRFKGSEGDHGCKGGMLLTMKGDENKGAKW